LEDKNDGCINPLSDSVSETESDAINTKPSSSNKLLVSDSIAVEVLPVDGGFFNRAFTPEELHD